MYLDLIDPVAYGPNDGAGTVPLTPESWITMLAAAPSAARASEALAEEGLLLPALLSFHAAAFALERLNRRLAAVDQANLERARSTSRRSDEEGARRRLFNLYGLSKEGGGEAEDSALSEALRIIGHREGISFAIPSRPGRSKSTVGLDDILDASGVRARQVRAPVRCGSSGKKNGGSATPIRYWRFERRTIAPWRWCPACWGATARSIPSTGVAPV